MSRFEILVQIRMAYKRTMQEVGDELRALAEANRVAYDYAGSLKELNELRRAALKGARYV